MNIGRKKDLLILSDKFSESVDKVSFINSYPKINAAIQIAKRGDNNWELEKILTAFSKSYFRSKAEKRNFINIDKEISRGRFSEELKKLTVEELEFVFSWTRRIIKGN